MTSPISQFMVSVPIPLTREELIESRVTNIFDWIQQQYSPQRDRYSQWMEEEIEKINKATAQMLRKNREIISSDQILLNALENPLYRNGSGIVPHIDRLIRQWDHLLQKMKQYNEEMLPVQATVWKLNRVCFRLRNKESEGTLLCIQKIKEYFKDSKDPLLPYLLEHLNNIKKEVAEESKRAINIFHFNQSDVVATFKVDVVTDKIMFWITKKCAVPTQRITG